MSVNIVLWWSFAGDLQDSASTSGCYLVLMGPQTYAPISWFCKKQGPVSHSSSESEVMSLDAALRMEGLPTLMLWDVILNVLGNKPMPSQNVSRAPISQTKHYLSYFMYYVHCLYYV